MEDLQRYVIKKLFRGAYWGSRFLNFDDLINPKTPRKELNKAVKDLIGLGYLFFKKGDKSSLFRYSLNPKMKKEIEDIISAEFTESRQH